jgi:hypothetical protein
MSLFHPPDERPFPGKTSGREDMVNVRFVELAPPRRIVEAVRFVTTDPAFRQDCGRRTTSPARAAGLEQFARHFEWVAGLAFGSERSPAAQCPIPYSYM